MADDGRLVEELALELVPLVSSITTDVSSITTDVSSITTDSLIIDEELSDSCKLPVGSCRSCDDSI